MHRIFFSPETRKLWHKSIHKPPFNAVVKKAWSYIANSSRRPLNAVAKDRTTLVQETGIPAQTAQGIICKNGNFRTP